MDLLADRAVDRHYTPSGIAAALAAELDFAGNSRPLVADLAAGDGALLAAVAERFPKSRLVATDVDSNAVARLRRRFPEWRVGRCNLLSPGSVARCSALRGLKPDAVVLNPPFSCRGGHVVLTDMDGIRVTSGIALAFVLRAVTLLSPRGQVLALLPAGALSSERDQMARRLLSRLCEMTILSRYAERSFPGTAAKTALVRFTCREQSDVVHRFADSRMRLAPTPDVVVYRGRLPIHEAATTYGVRLLHTTELKAGRIGRTARRAPTRYAIPGPLLLIPRVGEPAIGKIVLYSGQRRVALSDCLFALSASTARLRLTQRLITNDWRSFSGRYGGACAPFITLQAVLRALVRLGVNPDLETRLKIRLRGRFAQADGTSTQSRSTRDFPRRTSKNPFAARVAQRHETSRLEALPRN